MNRRLYFSLLLKIKRVTLISRIMCINQYQKNTTEILFIFFTHIMIKKELTFELWWLWFQKDLQGQGTHAYHNIGRSVPTPRDKFLSKKPHLKLTYLQPVYFFLEKNRQKYYVLLPIISDADSCSVCVCIRHTFFIFNFLISFYCSP